MIRHAKPGREHDGVELVELAVLRQDAILPHLGDAVGHDPDVRLGERGIVVVRDEDSLAADGVGRSELLAQDWVLHLGGQVHCREALDALPDGAVPVHGQHDELASEVEPEAVHLLGRWQELEEQLPSLADGRIDARHDPRRRALEQMELAHPRLDRGYDLDGGRAGADHADTLAREIVLVVPGCGMEHRALEALDAGNVGHRRSAEPAVTRDNDVGRERAVVRLDAPELGGSVPARRTELRVEANERAHAEAVGDVP